MLVEEWYIPGPMSGQGPEGYQRSDQRLMEDVCDRLTQHGQLDARNVDIQVTQGDVHLSGTVPDKSAKHLAESIAQNVQGVRDVTNHLRVSKQQGEGQQSQQGEKNQKEQKSGNGDGGAH